MRVPVPRNKLVAFTLAGAVLTAVLAVGLAYPGTGLIDGNDAAPQSDASSSALAADAPTPNQDFTPAVQPSSRDGEEEEHEYEEYDDDEHEEHEDEYEEQEEYDDDDDHEEYEDE